MTQISKTNPRTIFRSNPQREGKREREKEICLLSSGLGNSDIEVANSNAIIIHDDKEYL